MEHNPPGVRWTGRVRVDVCGFGDDRFCGETHQFREADVGLGKTRWETVCEVCALKWAVMATNIFEERLKLAKELGELMHCDEHSAYLMAARAFKPSKHGDNGFTLRPVIPARTNPAAAGRFDGKPAYRAPYAT